MARKRKPIRLGRLRESVRRTNMIYGLLVQAHDALRGQVIELEQRVHDLEKSLEALGQVPTPRR